MTIRKSRTLLTGAAASTGDWYQLDYRFDRNSQRSVFVTLTAGDTVYIEATPSALYSGDAQFLNPTMIVTIGTFVSSPGSALIEGPFAAIRARKTGTAGTCIVQGVL